MPQDAPRAGGNPNQHQQVQAPIGQPSTPNKINKAHLEVQHPVLIKEAVTSYHTYPIAGVDINGEPIECQRRFNLFYEFRECLLLKFPGLYIPPLSPKQVTGKTEILTLMER